MGNAMFCGAGCALVTPFKNGNVDFAAFENLIDAQIDAGVDALIVCATTGEASTLTDGEMCDITCCAVAKADGRALVIAGAGANSTRTAVRRASMLRTAGADCILSVTPYYNKCSQRGLIEHYTRVADAACVPTILYNVPQRTCVNLLPETVVELLKHPLIQGVKEACPDISQAARLINLAGDGCYVYCGDDIMTLPMLALGARGVISVAANVAPRETVELVRSAYRCDYDDARYIYNKLFPLYRALASDINPIPVKAALEMSGAIDGELRLPLTPLADEARAELARALADLNKE